MDPQISLRVVRGPDWNYGDQDGGECCLGTVVAVKAGREDNKVAVVFWDNGSRGEYRCGEDGKYDLRVLESSPAGVIHSGVSCDSCVHTGLTRSNIVGFRWKCSCCHDFDLCTTCYMKNKHSTRHRFVLWTKGKPQTLCASRADSRGSLLYPRGILHGAKVVRGADWEYGMKDGGNSSIGTTTISENISKSKGMVEVEWPNKEKGRYRVGHQGKVDLQLAEMFTLSFSYYIDHLPILGAPLEPIGAREFKVGDLVRVELDVEMFELMQEGHGGWCEPMGEMRNKIGIIYSIDRENDVRVRYGDNAFFINPEALVKVECPRLGRGDIVRVMDNREEMVKMQKGFGEWNEDMSEILGRAVVVKSVMEGMILIHGKGRQWTVCPLALSQAEDITDEERQALSPVVHSVMSGDEDSEDLNQLRMKLLLLKTIDTENSEILAVGTLLNDDEAVESFLKQFPNEVNAKSNGKTALHSAAFTGNMSLMRLLLGYNADIDMLDSDGMSALHYSSIRCHTDAITMLLEHGADPNIVNSEGRTPLVAAVHKGQAGSVAALACHKKTNLCAQDLDGQTAIHIAIHKMELDCLRELIAAKADLNCVNFKLEKPIHFAAANNFTEAVKELVLADPQMVNLRNDEMCTPLHLAAGLNREEVVRILLDQPICDLEAKSNDGVTPLIVSIVKGESNMVELLVTHGANVNAIDLHGNTPLHYVFHSPKSLVAQKATTPTLSEIRQDLLVDHPDVETFVTVACFLILSGANRTAVNWSGESPMNSKSLERSIVEKYVQNKVDSKASWIKHQTNSSVATESLQQLRTFGSYHSHLPSLFHEQEKDQLLVKKNGPLSQHCTESSHDSSGNSHTSAVSANTHTPDTLGLAAASSMQVNPVQSISGTDSQSGQQVCRLCENIVSVKMEPCGHAVLCHICARRATKCLHCRRPVQAVVNL